jgi:predicted PurR-regulated permease PerM
MATSYATNVTDSANSQVSSFLTTIQSNIDAQNAALNELENKNTELYQKYQIQLNQVKEIEDKEKLLLTRSRMLQIAQDRNSYKKKIIYTLVAFIFALFIFTLVVYVYFLKKNKRNALV